MKKVLQPKRPEEAVYYSDFSGKIFKDYVPVTVKVQCGYGSKHDGAEIEFHLSDKGLEKLLDFFKQNLCQETKDNFKRYIKEKDEQYEDSVENRDWQSGEFIYNNKDLYQKLI